MWGREWRRILPLLWSSHDASGSKLSYRPERHSSWLVSTWNDSYWYRKWGSSLLWRLTSGRTHTSAKAKNKKLISSKTRPPLLLSVGFFWHRQKFRVMPDLLLHCRSVSQQWLTHTNETWRRRWEEEGSLTWNSFFICELVLPGLSQTFLLVLHIQSSHLQASLGLHNISELSKDKITFQIPSVSSIIYSVKQKLQGKDREEQMHTRHLLAGLLSCDSKSAWSLTKCSLLVPTSCFPRITAMCTFFREPSSSSNTSADHKAQFTCVHSFWPI